ncbi:lipopolysaccharide biosynthesis protein [Pseudoalteromonas rubra]|uniref:lipopolysaccharide biosynthesis protein n=1 Tax=Pseudoalteromonas rubra TaxID=43658 RepID=UPI000F777DE0|nr:oligosaccharide flippase family protein [Pseudoalteromonas rubra]
MSKLREISRNFFSIGIIDFVGLLVPIITMPILTRTLGSESYGVYLLLVTILFFGHTIIDFGTQFTSVREISNNKSDRASVVKIYKETQSLRILLSLVYTILCVVYSYFFIKSDFFLFMLIAAPMYLIGYALTPVWYYQGMSSMSLVTKVSFLVKLANILVIVFLVKNPEDLFIALLGCCLPIFIGGLYLLQNNSNSDKLDIGITFRVLPKLKNSLSVFIGLLAPNFYNSVPTIFLGSTYPPEQFAKFAVASRLCSVVVTLQNVLSKAVFPILSRTAKTQVNKLLLANLAISIPALLFIYFLGEFTLKFFLGSEFSGSNEYLLVLTVGVVFIGIANAYSQGFFLPKGFDSLFRNISLRISILSGVLSAWMVIHWGLLGGAISITVARGLFMADFFISYQCLKKSK